MECASCWRETGLRHDRQQRLSAIAALLQQTSADLRDFLAAIATERQCLIDGRTSELPAIADRKSALTLRLADLEARREAALVAGGFDKGRQGIAAWLVATPATRRQQAHDAWRHCLDLAARAERENALNGKLIAARLQQNHQALEVLLGAAAEAAPYGANGQRSSASGKRPLGSA